MALAQKYCVIYLLFVILTAYTHGYCMNMYENTFFENHFFHSYFDIFFFSAQLDFSINPFIQIQYWLNTITSMNKSCVIEVLSLSFKIRHTDDSITTSTLHYIPLSASGPRAKPISKTWNDISYHITQRIE